jgi:hypothetical protein
LFYSKIHLQKTPPKHPLQIVSPIRSAPEKKIVVGSRLVEISSREHFDILSPHSESPEFGFLCLFFSP